MRILIDCGAYKADTLNPLIESFGPFDRVFALEPNPEFAPCFSALDSGPIELIQAAAWIHDGTTKLYLGDIGIESSLLLQKTTGNLNAARFVEVPCLDFSAWLRRTVVATDFVVLKMDIEGAELEVLDKMIADNTIELVDMLLPEWHSKRLNIRWAHLRRKWIEFRLWSKGIKTLRWSKKYYRNNS